MSGMSNACATLAYSILRIEFHAAVMKGFVRRPQGLRRVSLLPWKKAVSRFDVERCNQKHDPARWNGRAPVNDVLWAGLFHTWNRGRARQAAVYLLSQIAGHDCGYGRVFPVFGGHPMDDQAAVWPADRPRSALGIPKKKLSDADGRLRGSRLCSHGAGHFGRIHRLGAVYQYARHCGDRCRRRHADGRRRVGDGRGSAVPGAAMDVAESCSDHRRVARGMAQPFASAGGGDPDRRTHDDRWTNRRHPCHMVPRWGAETVVFAVPNKNRGSWDLERP